MTTARSRPVGEALAVPRPLPLSGRPTGAVDLPAAVAAIVDPGTTEAVWRNELGGLTFSSGDRFVKWAPAGSGLDLEAERARLEWAARWTTVPELLGHGRDDDGSWLVTRALAGRNAVDPYWAARPAQAARLIGAALRDLHDALPVEGCPFDWSVAERTARAGIDPARVGLAPPVGRLVVCHGDACAPNTLLSDDGSWTGHVDLGRLGVGDLWGDLAIAAWSTEWNYGPGYDADVYAGYGVEPDQGRIAFYRRLWDAT
ncbi:aminoglycoside 3'-phosphotransferase [Cellulomonas edaphi]|uniref:Aminoglycoside 3'-phosphotransferase n=1 Tax=Cellulomonas edaphi TaxID=3053468 RepID=A0ABT7S8H2_9CELL|nr:aminoglycoside 3'-phosphotransferase [Cellulomons edaphi]MDM7831911.1 aminoglycoside 3'-phosphotransferase [Cellulomons edaphi]